MNTIHRDVENYLCKHFNLATPELLSSLSAEAVYMAGRDLQLPSLKKIACNKQLGTLAAELSLKKNLRLAFDQVILTNPLPKNTQNEAFSHLLKKSYKLPEISSVQGIVGGVVIMLSQKNHLSEEEEAHYSSKNLFPKEPGSAVFFNQYFPISLDLLFQMREASYLLIAYSEKNSVYIFNEKDPHTHALKSQGYAFGDRLLEKDHPTVSP